MDLRTTALRLIKTHGAAIAIKRTLHSGYDVDIGDIDGVVKNYTSYAVNSEFLRGANSEAYVRDGITLLIAPGDYVPEEGDVITWSAKTYIVKTVKPISPAGVDQLYEVAIDQ